MKYAIAIWGFCWDTPELPGAMRGFAEYGFDTISFHPDQLLGASAEDKAALTGVLEELDLAATVHGSCKMGREAMESLVGLFGPRLAAFTMDAAKTKSSLGNTFDARQNARALRDIQELTDGMDTALAVEDFPLDGAAWDFFREDLGDVYEHARTGILVDVGHLHIRLSTEYYAGKTVQDYFSDLPVSPVELHLHDNDGVRDLHAPFGTGTLPFEEAASAVRSIGFDGISTVEVCPKLHGAEKEASKLLAREALDSWRGYLADAKP